MSNTSMIGRTIDHGRYRLTRWLGGGGFGDVYLADDTTLPRKVAVKTIKSGLNDPEFAKRFAREAQTIATLDHPHIVTVLAFGTDDDLSYLVMKYLSGGSLKDRLEAVRKGKRPPPTLEETAALLTDIASALDYAHKHGVIHRDVKPANIMFDEDGRAFLVDFGIARPSTRSGNDSTFLRRAYTPNYAAPEQVTRQPTTPKIDQYALAVVAYAMVTNALPFEGDSEEVQDKKAQGDPLPASHHRPDLPRGLVDVLAKALARDPEKRYASVGAFAAAFAHYAGQGAAKPPKRALWAGAAVLLVAVLALAGLAGVLSSQVTPATASSPTATAPPNATPLDDGGMIFEPAATTPAPATEIAQAATSEAEAAATRAAVRESLNATSTQLAVFELQLTEEQQAEDQTATASVPTPTPTPSETPQPTNTFTATPVPPTASPAPTTTPAPPTPEPLLVLSDTPRPTETPSVTPSPTWTATPTINAAATQTSDARLYQLALTQVIREMTGTAAAWTPTPSLTQPSTTPPEPSDTPRPTVDAGATQLARAQRIVDTATAVANQHATQTAAVETLRASRAQGVIGTATANALTAEATATARPLESAIPTPTGMPDIGRTFQLLGAFPMTDIGDMQLAAVDATGNLVRFIADMPGGSFDASLSSDGRIVFASNQDVNPDLFIMNADGTGLRKLTFAPSIDRAPSWSPDGTEIIFETNSDGSVFDYSIYAMNVETGSWRRLIQNVGFGLSPAWSPNGESIAYSNQFGLFLVDPDGQDPRRLVSANLYWGQPAWSPDGSRIAFVSGDDNARMSISVVDSNGENLLQLTQPAAGVFSPVWSPDGAQIMFTEDGRLFVMDADGTRRAEFAGVGAVYAWLSEPLWDLQCAVTGDADVHTGPGVERTVRGSLPYYAQSFVRDSAIASDGSLWLNVQLPGVTTELDRYWVAANDVNMVGECDQHSRNTLQLTATPQALAATTPPTQQSLVAQVTVNTDSINLRSGPGTNYNILDSAERGTVFDVVARTEDAEWYLVERDNGSRVWVSASLVLSGVSTSNIEIAATVPAPPEASIPVTSGNGIVYGTTLRGGPVTSHTDYIVNTADGNLEIEITVTKAVDYCPAYVLFWDHLPGNKLYERMITAPVYGLRDSVQLPGPGSYALELVVPWMCDGGEGHSTTISIAIFD